MPCVFGSLPVSDVSRFIWRQIVAIFNPSEFLQSTAVQDAGPKLVPADELYIKLKKLQMEYEFLDIQVSIGKYKVIMLSFCSRCHCTCVIEPSLAVILSLACRFLACVA